MKMNGRIFSLRSDVHALRKRIMRNKAIKIELDFSEIMFVSGGYTDELLNMINDLEKKGKRILILNLNSDVKKMIHTISNRKLKLQTPNLKY
jgi:anti-anti-sigma regulatory factor